MFLSLLIFWMGEAPVLFAEPLSPRIANYQIQVDLDAENRLLRGHMFLVWHNQTDQEVADLQFHLYMNAFRNSESTFMRESKGRHRGNAIEDDGWGFCELDSLRYAALESTDQKFPGWQGWNPPEQWSDLLAHAHFISPDDGNPEDRTVLALALAEPLRPGQRICVEADFRTRLPQPPFARTGMKENYAFVGQWFPKIGVLTANGWNCHQFHLNSEFFADYGVYDVTMTVPKNFVLGATGQLVEALDQADDMRSHFYHAEDVHDFAWTCSPEFLEFTGQAQDVAIRALVQPDHAEQGPRHVEAARQAVIHFQDNYGDYPFPNLTVVDPRRGAEGSGGMEYPTLITAGTTHAMPEGIRFLELVIYHEFGHNYWYHLLASNEFEESWLDEGINTFTEMEMMQELHGKRGNLMELPGLNVDIENMHWMRYASLPDADPMVRRSWEYMSGGSYGTNSYSRPGVILTTLDRHLGKGTMRRILREYTRRHRFTHPTTRDFVAVAEEVSGQSLSWFFDPILHGTETVDFKVHRAVSEKREKPAGFDFTLNTADPSTWTGSEDKKAEGEDEEEEEYLSEVVVRRIGSFRIPVEVEFHFEDGQTSRETWPADGTWARYTFTTAVPLVRVVVDPERRILMDLQPSNNTHHLEKPSRVGSTASWWVRMAGILSLLGF